MSIAGIASTALYSVLSGIQGSQSQQGNFQQLQIAFQQLGQDLESGNLTQAQQDYAALSQDFPNGSQTGSAASSNPVAQAFTSLSQALQNGNLSAAQQDSATIQQDFQQQQQGGSSQVHHHHHHGGGSGQQGNQVSQELNSLSQALQSGNLSGAQSAFAILEQDLQQFGFDGGSSAATGSSSSAQSAGTNLSVTV